MIKAQQEQYECKLRMNQEKIERLKSYFSKRDDIVLAFLFGSQTSGRNRPASDWDIAVYFKSSKGIEIESKTMYTGENAIPGDLERLLKSEVDVVVLNRARPSLVFSILNTGISLAIKDQKLYLELLVRTHYEAVDFWNFVQEFWKIREQAASLTPEAKALLIEHLTFLENEYADLPKFQKLSWEQYIEDRSIRRNLERWIENLVMASLDIAKIIIASAKKDVPQTYRETLRVFGAEHFDTSLTDRFAATAEMRNLVAHEYLDIRWDRIKKFIDQADKVYPAFLQKVKKMVS